MENPDHLKARAEEADRILHGPVFSDAMAGAREEFIRNWLEADNTPDRESAHAQVHALVEVQRQLRRIINRGVVAAAEQE